MNTAVHVVLDKVFPVNFFHDANQFFIQVEKTSKTSQTNCGADTLSEKDDLDYLSGIYPIKVTSMAAKVINCIKTQLGAHHCCYKRHNLARHNLVSLLRYLHQPDRIHILGKVNPGPKFND